MLNMDPARELVGYFVRHGELVSMSIWDSWGDYALSEKGVQSAERAAQWLSYLPIGRIVSSDLPRTIQTADCIMSACNVACPMLTTDPNLRPWLLPDFQGKEKTPERIREFEQYIVHPDRVVPGGESRDQLDLRVQVAAVYFATPYDGKPTVIACHNSAIKAFMGLDDVKEACAPGGIIAVYLNPKGEFEFEVVLGETPQEIGVS